MRPEAGGRGAASLGVVARRLKDLAERAVGRGTDDLEIQDRPAVEEPFVPPDLRLLQETVTGTAGRSGMAGHVLFLYNLVVGVGARWVVEIGLGPGDSTSIFLLALSRTGGRLVSIDVAPQPVAEAKIARLGLRSRWEFVPEPSERAARHWPAGRPIDLLLIDGKHSYDQVRLEYRLYRPLMTPGGFVLFHDSETIEGVRRFVREVARRDGGVQFPFCNGLFVTRVPEERGRP